MKFLINLLVSALAVCAAAWLLPGVSVDGIGTAIVVAIILGLLNAVVRPLLIILTLPVTILTLGLFLLVINVLMIYLTDSLISGFEVSGFLSALIFSLLVSVLSAVIGSVMAD